MAGNTFTRSSIEPSTSANTNHSSEGADQNAMNLNVMNDLRQSGINFNIKVNRFQY